jgi:RNA recognition motif-containing protein
MGGAYPLYAPPLYRMREINLALRIKGQWERTQSSMRLYVCNVHYDATEDDLRAFFIDGGYLPSAVKIMTDRQTGDSRGFAFLDIAEDGQKAIEDMDDQKFMGRRLKVKEALPEPPRDSPGKPKQREHAQGRR